MTQTLNLGANLGAANTGLTIGYRILDLDGTVVTAFTTTNVTEAPTAGTYYVATTVSVPDAGGVIIWGESGNDIVTGIIDPVPVVDLVADAVDADALAADAVTEIQSGLATSAALATVDTVVDNIAVQTTAIVADTNELQIDWVDGGRLDLILNARASQSSVDTIDANVDAVLLDTSTEGVVVADKTGYSLAPDQSGVTVGTANTLGAQAKLDVNAEVDTALSDVGVTTTVTGRIDAAISTRSSHSAADVWTVITRTLTANTNLNDPTVAAIADAVLDELLSGHTTAGTAGEALGRLDATVSSRSTLTAAEANAEVDTALADYDAATGTELTTTQTAITAAISALGNLTASDVWTYATRTLTQSTASIIAAVEGTTLGVVRAVTFDVTISGLAIPDSWETARFTVKKRPLKTQPDATSALIQILVTSGGDEGDGLVVLNSSDESLTAANASLTVGATSVDVHIEDAVTAVMATGNYEYDIKFYYGTSDSVIVATGAANVSSTPTETV